MHLVHCDIYVGFSDLPTEVTFMFVKILELSPGLTPAY